MTSILFVIGKRPGMNQKSLADLLVLDQSTMSRDLKRLMNRKLIVANKSKEDPRNKELELTKEGYKLVDEIAPLWHEVHEKMEKLLGSFNIQQVDGIMEAVKSNLAYLKE